MANVTPIFLAVLIVALQNVLCTNVKFYERPFYHGFIKEVLLNGAAETDCILVSRAPIQVSSIKTDRCLMLYSSRDCKRVDNSSQSFRVERNTRELNNTFIVQTTNRTVNSFHVCSQSRGGGLQVDVDFYDKAFYQGNIVARFRDVCGCHNLPRVAWGGKYRQISVDNHGRSIDLFESENCKAEFRTLEAGYNGESQNLWISRKTVDPSEMEDRMFDVRSFRPSGYQTCMRLDARIYEFYFKNASDPRIPMITENTKLGANTIMQNNGSVKLVQKYGIDTKLIETLYFTIAPAFSNMFTLGLDANYEEISETGVPIVTNGKFKYKLGLNYQYERIYENSSMPTNLSISNEETILVRQAIELPPCTQCIVSSFLKKVTNFPIQYNAYARVRGMTMDERMTAEEIRTYLEPGIEYLKDVDENTIEVKVTGIMYAEYGMRAYVSSDCQLIARCLTGQQIPEIVNKTNTVEIDLPV